MSKYICAVSICSVLCGAAAHAAPMTPQIQKLLKEKQDKIAQLEKCEGKKQGFMIAGISTIGLTAVGVVGNIALANKSKNLDTDIDASRQTLAAKQNELSDLNSQIAERERIARIERAREQCNKTTGKRWDAASETCVVDATKTAMILPTDFNPTMVADAVEETKEEVKAGTKEIAEQKPVKTQSVPPQNVTTPVAETGATEPRVDATKWTEAEYKKCFENFFPSNSSSISNASSYWARSNNGKYCNGYSGGRYLYNYKKSRNTCALPSFSSMSNGEWSIKLKNGKTMRGIAVCSNTAGARGELRDNVSSGGNGLNCWCKLTHTDLSECLITEKFSWMFVDDFWLVNDSDLEEYADGYDEYHDLMPDEYYHRGENGCAWRCANECGYELFDYGNHFQRAMHGVPLIRQYIKH